MCATLWGLSRIQGTFLLGVSRTASLLSSNKPSYRSAQMRFLLKLLIVRDCCARSAYQTFWNPYKRVVPKFVTPLEPRHGKPALQPTRYASSCDLLRVLGRYPRTPGYTAKRIIELHVKPVSGRTRNKGLNRGRSMLRSTFALALKVTARLSPKIGLS